jgi:DNA invertase Pin-like site-specific DNA recombinase
VAKPAIHAVSYIRTSSPTNVGPDKDSDKRQRAAVEAFAKANGYRIVDEYSDTVSGAETVTKREGFAKLLERIAGNGERVILIESPDRFARDLTVQLTGHDHLKRLGVTLIPTTAPDHFIEDTPTAKLVRQVLGAIAEFDKATLVAKLAAARARKRAAGGYAGGQKAHALTNPKLVALAKQLRGKGKRRRSLRQVSAELAKAGHVNVNGKPYAAASVQSMLDQ